MKQSIYLLEPSLLTPDRYFKVYSIEPSLLFVKVGGQFYDETSDDEAPLVVGLVMMLLRKLFLNKLKIQRETVIDNQANDNPEVLRNKKQNFDIPLQAIKKVELRTKSTKHTNGTDNGVLFLYTENGTEKKYTIP